MSWANSGDYLAWAPLNMLGQAVFRGQRQNVGGVMLDHLLDGARALGLPVVELTHESSNERAARLYQSRGFVYTGEEEVSDGGARVERRMRWSG